MPIPSSEARARLEAAFRRSADLVLAGQATHHEAIHAQGDAGRMPFVVVVAMGRESAARVREVVTEVSERITHSRGGVHYRTGEPPAETPREREWRERAEVAEVTLVDAQHWRDRHCADAAAANAKVVELTEELRRLRAGPAASAPAPAACCGDPVYLCCTCGTVLGRR